VPGPIKILFVCGRNQWRSPTAVRVFRDDARVAACSAGVSSKGGHELSGADLEWADLVLVMERRYLARIRSGFGGRMDLPRIESLDIPDEFGYMDPELVALIRSSVEPYIMESKAGPQTFPEAAVGEPAPGLKPRVRVRSRAPRR
jgi:predicted protein tyrosine phosphatase